MMKELESGQRFRGILIHSLLSKGERAAAYMASHPVLEMPLVVKTFTSDDKRLFRDIRLLARVSNRHVVDVIDAGIEDETPFVVLRYIDGIDLGELMEHLLPLRRALPMHLLIPLVADVARGVHAVHLSGGLHRDLNPSNIFLSGNGGGVVADFGMTSRTIASNSDPAADPADDADPGLPDAGDGDAAASLCGTALFRAPEIWQGSEPSTRSDIYALGAAAHFLATGAPPFHAAGAELKRAHIEDPYQSPPAEWPESAYFFSLLSAMLAKSPADRPDSAGDVAALLSRVTPDAPRMRRDSDTTAEIAGIYVEIYTGDIAVAEADVIVSAADWTMKMETGVADALRRAGGDELQTEAQGQAPASIGDVVWTGAGRLQGTWVAHAVAAFAGAVCIQRCTMRVLLDAQARGARSVVFPPLGTGTGQVPTSIAADKMLRAIHTFAQLGPTAIEQIAIALPDDDALAEWSRILCHISGQHLTGQ